MRTLVFLFCMALACIPSEEDIVDQYQAAADDAVIECQDYYRETVLPEILGIIAEVC